MKAHRNHHAHEAASRVKNTDVIPLNENVKKQMHLYQIAIKMQGAALSEQFIVYAVRIASTSESVFNLMQFWEEETDKKERDEIVADIQDLIDDSAQKGITEKKYIRFNDLDSVSKNIRAFKDSLLTTVMERGDISHLAELTGIPQPSLSRFFNTNTMPRRATLLKIAKALKLDKLKIEEAWIR